MTSVRDEKGRCQLAMAVRHNCCRIQDSTSRAIGMTRYGLFEATNCFADGCLQILPSLKVVAHWHLITSIMHSIMAEFPSGRT